MIDHTSLTWRVFATVVRQETRHDPCLYEFPGSVRDPTPYHWLVCSKCNRVLLRNIISVEDAHQAWRRSYPPADPRSRCNG